MYYFKGPPALAHLCTCLNAKAFTNGQQTATASERNDILWCLCIHYIHIGPTGPVYYYNTSSINIKRINSVRKLQSSLLKFQSWSWFHVVSVSNALPVYGRTFLCCHSEIYQIAMMGGSAKQDNNFTFPPPQKKKERNSKLNMLE